MNICSYNEAIALLKAWQDQVWQASALEGLTIALVIQAWTPVTSRFDVSIPARDEILPLTRFTADQTIYRQHYRQSLLCIQYLRHPSQRFVRIPLIHSRTTRTGHHPLLQDVDSPVQRRGPTTSRPGPSPPSRLRRSLPAMRSLPTRRLGIGRMDRTSTRPTRPSACQDARRVQDVRGAGTSSSTCIPRTDQHRPSLLDRTLDEHGLLSSALDTCPSHPPTYNGRDRQHLWTHRIQEEGELCAERVGGTLWRRSRRERD